MLTPKKPKSISRFRYLTGAFVTGISAIGGLLGLIGLMLIWIGLCLSLFSSKDHSEWLIMGTAEEFFGLENFLRSLYITVAGFLGISLGEWLEGKTSTLALDYNRFEKSVKDPKTIRILALFFGLTSIVYVAISVFHYLSIPWNLMHIWILLSLWPRQLILILSHPQILLKLKLLGYFYLITYTGSLVSSVILAKKTNRYSILCFIITFLFPYALIFLSFNKKFLLARKR